jgi:hypothetical protein
MKAGLAVTTPVRVCYRIGAAVPSDHLSTRQVNPLLPLATVSYPCGLRAKNVALSERRALRCAACERDLGVKVRHQVLIERRHPFVQGLSVPRRQLIGCCEPL